MSYPIVTISLDKIPTLVITEEREMRSETKGIKLSPIRLRNSLYLLIPIEVAKLLAITKETDFYLNIKHDKNTVLTYRKIEDLSIEKGGGGEEKDSPEHLSP